MSGIIAIARRELGNYFATSLGWLALCSFVTLTGFFFALIVNDWRQWNHAASQRFLTKQEDAMRAGQMGIHTAGFVALCLLI